MNEAKTTGGVLEIRAWGENEGDEDGGRRGGSWEPMMGRLIDMVYYVSCVFVATFRWLATDTVVGVKLPLPLN